MGNEEAARGRKTQLFTLRGWSAEPSHIKRTDPERRGQDGQAWGHSLAATFNGLASVTPM